MDVIEMGPDDTIVFEVNRPLTWAEADRIRGLLSGPIVVIDQSGSYKLTLIRRKAA